MGILIGANNEALTVASLSEPLHRCVLAVRLPERSFGEFLAFAAASFITLSPPALPYAGLTVPKSQRSSSSEPTYWPCSSSPSLSSSSELLPWRACHRSCLSINSVRYAGFLALRKNACFSNSFALGLSLGSFRKHDATKSLKVVLKFPSSFGGLCFGIKKRTFMGCISDNGGSPMASSIAVMPRDQISALWS